MDLFWFLSLMCSGASGGVRVETARAPLHFVLVMAVRNIGFGAKFKQAIVIRSPGARLDVSFRKFASDYNKSAAWSSSQPTS